MPTVETQRAATQMRKRVANILSPLRPMPRAGSRMRPDYLVVGTKRGGSTSFADWLEQHPAVAPCLAQKGTHYFDTNFRRGRAWYASRFEKSSAGYGVTGEASPYYMFHPLAPERIKAELPDVKIIAVLRDPVDRLLSHYRYEVERGHEREPLERALDLEDTRLAGEVERLSQDASYEGYRYRHFSYLHRGHYAEQITHLHTLFAPENLLVLQSEHMFAHPNETLASAWPFLGLEPFHVADLAPLNATKTRPDVDDDMLERLREYYRQRNESLYALPGIDWRWPSH